MFFQLLGSSQGFIMHWRAGLEATSAPLMHIFILSKESFGPGEARGCLWKGQFLHDLLLHQGDLQRWGESDYIGRRVGRGCCLLASGHLHLQVSLSEEVWNCKKLKLEATEIESSWHWKQLKLLPTLHFSLILILATVRKQLRFHLCFLPEIDPISSLVCRWRERESWCFHS